MRLKSTTLNSISTDKSVKLRLQIEPFVGQPQFRPERSVLCKLNECNCKLNKNNIKLISSCSIDGLMLAGRILSIQTVAFLPV